MARKFGEIELDNGDWKRFQRAVRRSSDTDLPKRLGQANKEIGQRFISEWLHPKPDPQAVGEGRGAAVRPSASKREVLLRVGGGHRADHTPQMQWGKRLGRPIRRKAPPRPYIRESVERHRPQIMDAWLEAVSKAMGPAFYDTEP